jgi:electron transfer flavoprotein alpha/beta subunit
MFDGNTRTLATSDLHQTFWTVETKKALDRLKAKSRRASRPRKVKVDALAMGDDEPVVIEDETVDAAFDPLAKLRELVGV